MSDAELDALPHGWSWCDLGEVADFINGDRGRNYPSKSARVAVGVPFINAGHLAGGVVDMTAMDFISRERFDLLGSGKVHRGDVLYCLRGSLGKSAIVTNIDEGAIASSLLIVRPMPSTTSECLFAYLNSPLGKAMISRYDNGTAQPNLSAGNVAKYSFPLAPLAEQRRMVDAVDSYLSRLDAAVATLEAAQKKLKAYRASVLKAAVEGRLVPTEASLARAEKRDYEPADVLLKRILVERRRRWEEAELAKLKAAGKTPKDDRWKAKYEEPKALQTTELPELPEGWCWANLAQLIVSLDQGWSPQCERRAASADEWGVIKTTAVQHMGFIGEENKAITSDLEPRPPLELRAGDLLITRAGPRSRVGVCGLVRHIRAQVMLCDKVYRIRSAELVSSPFLEVVLNSPSVLSIIERMKTGISDSGVNLTQERFLGLPVPLPPRAEQEAIESAVAAQLSVADATSAAAATDIQRVGRLRQAVLKWAFEGKLVDQDPNDEPTEKLLARIRADPAGDTQPKRTRRAKAAE